jgi:hypothetical protein
MKHYLLSPEGLKRIATEDIAKWQHHGSFMKSEGPVSIPVALGQPDAECVDGLLKKAENFVFWFTPDYRAVFTTKEAQGQNAWKVRFELRGLGKNGKACIQAVRVDRKLYAHAVIQVIAEWFTSLGKQHGVALPEAPSDVPAAPNDQEVVAPAS